MEKTNDWIELEIPGMGLKKQIFAKFLPIGFSGNSLYQCRAPQWFKKPNYMH